MMKTTMITALAALNVSAVPTAEVPTAPGANSTPTATQPLITSMGLQFAHLDMQASREGMQAKISDKADFAFHLELGDGHAIHVRF